MKEFYQFLKDNGPVFLASSADDEATIRPFGFIGLVDNTIIFATSQYGRCAAQLKKNPRFEGAAVDMGTYRWARFSATAEEITDREVKEAVIAANPNLANFQGADNIFMFKAAQGKGSILSLAGAPAKDFEF